MWGENSRTKAFDGADVTVRSKADKGGKCIYSGGSAGALVVAKSFLLRWPPCANGAIMDGFDETKMRGEVQIGLLPVPGTPPVEWLESPDPVDYQTALAVMTERAAAIARGEANELVWLLEHPALYTAGTSSRPHELIDARFPVYQTGRGGQFTYHGPGQRVAYLMLDLKRRAPDVRRFVATVEEWIIRALDALGVAGERRSDRIGVWVRRRGRNRDAEDKIAAIGVRVRQWITLHGVALNVTPDLSHFSGIVPCGISDPRYGITSLAALGITVSTTEVDGILRREFEPLFGGTSVAVQKSASFLPQTRHADF
jgi:lipoyl(octanoyl) transferase